MAAIAGLLVATPALSQTAAKPADDPGCAEKFDPAKDYFPEKVDSKHSTFWDIRYHGNYKVLSVTDTESTTGAKNTYVLVQCGTPTPELAGDLKGAIVATVPIRRAIVTHRNVLSMLHEIDEASSIVGLTKQFFDYAAIDPWYADLIKRSSNPQNVGKQEDIDYETSLTLQSDAIFMAGYGQGQTYVSKVRDRGLPVVLISNRPEPTPLGSAEWLKLIAAFYNKEKSANTIFTDIETDYTAIAKKVADRLPKNFEAAYGCAGDEGGCGFFFAHGEQSLNGQILKLMGVTNSFAENNPQPNGMAFDYESALGRSQKTSFFVVYYIDSPLALARDARYKNVPALAAGKYIVSTRPNYHECNAVTYVRVDQLIRDYAIGMLPDLYPGQQGVCFKAP
jgi:iron complex transport system substrate-binding protein